MSSFNDRFIKRDAAFQSNQTSSYSREITDDSGIAQNRLDRKIFSSEDGFYMKYGRFIEQNMYRIPNFQTVDAAETALKDINEKFKQPQYRLQSQSKRKSLEDKLRTIQDQHQSIKEEQQRIKKYKTTADNALQNEEKEYQIIKAKIVEAKGKLAELQYNQTNLDAELKRAQTEYEKVLKKNKLFQMQRNQLLEEQKKLDNHHTQLKIDLKVLDEQMLQHNANERKVINLENINNDKQNQYNMLLHKHQEYMNKIKTVDAETQKYMRIADEKGNEYEDILNNVRAKHRNDLYSDSDDIDMSQFKSALMSTPNRSTFFDGSPGRDSLVDSAILKTPDRKKSSQVVYQTPRSIESPGKLYTPKKLSQAEEQYSSNKKASTIFQETTPLKESYYGLSSFINDSPKPVKSVLRKGNNHTPNDNRVHFDERATHVHVLSSDDNLESDNFLDSDTLLEDIELPTPSLTDDLVKEAMRAINQSIIEGNTIMSRH